MPTLNPRVNVTLSISLDMLVAQLASLQRVSKSQVLRELLEAAEPYLQRAVALMEIASTASVEARTGLAHKLGRDLDTAQDSVALLLARVDRGIDLVSQAEAVRGKRPARVAAKRGAPPSRGERSGVTVAKNPPASYRGVKSTSRATGKVKK